MNRNSLQIELDKLRTYLSKLKRQKLGTNDYVTHSYILTGMIETIYSLVSTGAYYAVDGSLEELFDAITQARNLAVHYAEADNYAKMLEVAQNIVLKTPREFEDTIADDLDKYITQDSDDYLLVYKTDIISIKDSDDIYKDSYLIENIRTKEKIYVPKEHLVIIDNRHSGGTSFLVRLSDDAKVYYKANDTTPTTIVSLKELYKNHKLDTAYRGKPKIIKFDNIISKMAKLIKQDPYEDKHFSYTYDKKTFRSKAYNVLNDFLQRRVINERFVFGPFKVGSFAEDAKKKTIAIPSVDKKELLNHASLKDMFYIELFLKEYGAFKEKIRRMEGKSEEEIMYAKQALLIELFKNGPAYLSEHLIKHNSDFASLYYDFKKERNILSHNPLNDEEKANIIDNLEKYSQALYEVLQPSYSLYTKDKRKYPYAYLNGAIPTSDGKFIHNKLTEYHVYKHTGETMVVGGVKYLRLNYKGHPNLYIKVDGSLYVYNYLTESSYECIAPKSGTQIVEIDKNGVVKPSKVNLVEGKDPILVDFDQDAIFQAYNYLKSYPQADSSYFESKSGVKCAPIITIYSAYGPMYSDRLKNFILRRNNQHFLPRELLSCCKCKFYNDLNKPIEILDKNNNIIATIYYGHVAKNGIITQVLTDGTTQAIEHGDPVSRSLDTSEIITEVKLERNKR